MQASNISTYRCEEELGLEPTLSARQGRNPSHSSLPPLDTSVQSAHSLPSSVPYTGVSPGSAQHPSLDVPRVASPESTFSGAELSNSPQNELVTPGSASISADPQTPGGEHERQSFGTDELEGLAEDRVVAHGYLLCLKNVSGVRQWKRRWVVLRGRSLTLYKNFEVCILLGRVN